MVDNFGGRKFIAFLISLIFGISIFIVMLLNKWLTATNCLDFLTFISVIAGLFTGGNLLDKYITKKQEVK